MHPSFESWVLACNMMLEEESRFRSYIQWYPFSQLNSESWQLLKSEGFYRRYIEDGAFILSEQMRFTTKGYVQKQGVTMRDTHLVSPVLYLYLLAVGIEYEQIYTEGRPEMVCLYAGDIGRRQAHYRKSYKVFRDSVTYCSERFGYCLKTDIVNFYGAINVDALMSSMQDYSSGCLSVSDCLFLRSLLLYCGKGRFPTIQNHTTLSFLATKVYLSRVDSVFHERLNAMPDVSSYELVRYADDLYIFFNPASGSSLLNVQHAIANTYSDLLRSEGLALNQEKLKFMAASEARESMTTVSCVDFSGDAIDLKTSFDSDQIVSVLSAIAEDIGNGVYSHGLFLDAVSKGFTGGELTIEPMAAFRQCLFHQPELFRNPEVIKSLSTVLSLGNVALSFNTAAMVQCVLNTRDELLIKSLLNNLFESERRGTWGSLDALTALTYLQQRGMAHRDLIGCLRRLEPGLAQFCIHYCKRDFSLAAKPEVEEKTIEILRNDEKSKMLYAFSLSQNAVGDILGATAYYRAFFDRFTSLTRSRINGKREKWLYAEKELVEVYERIDNAKETIRHAEKMRQSNPLIHASSEVISSPSFKEDLKAVMQSLRSLMNDYLESMSFDDVKRLVGMYIGKSR